MKSAITATLLAISCNSAAWESKTEVDKIDGSVTHSIKLPSEPESGQKIATMFFSCTPSKSPAIKTMVVTQDTLKTSFNNHSPIRLKLLDRQPTAYDTLASSNGVIIMGQSVFNAAQEPNFKLLVEVRTLIFASQTFEFVNKDPELVLEFAAKCKQKTIGQ